MAKPKGKRKKRFKSRQKKNVPVAIVHVKATFNNTNGHDHRLGGPDNCLVQRGLAGLSRLAERNAFAAQQASLTAANRAKEHGVRRVAVRVKGPAAVASPPSGRSPRREFR